MLQKPQYLYRYIPNRYQLIPKVMNMNKIEIKKNEVIERKNNQIKRYPNLNTVIMVEDFLKKHKDIPIKMADLRRKLPRQVMYPTLKLIVEYLWKSGKIIFGPKGIMWIYSEPEHLKKMLKGGLEI